MYVDMFERSSSTQILEADIEVWQYPIYEFFVVVSYINLACRYEFVTCAGCIK